MTERGPLGEGAPDAEEIDRLVLKGLWAPLSPADAARLEALTSASPDAARRAESLVNAWLLTGAAGRERIEDGRSHAARRRWFVAAGGGAAAAAVAALWWGQRPSLAVYQAPASGPLRATLGDGTRIVISRGGRIEARLGADRRRLRLVRGEAFFAVARDARRPFEVEAGEHRLTVLGTQFNVSPEVDGLRVSLLEGSLRVERSGGPSYVLKPGEEYLAGRGLAPANVAAAAAWVDGRLVFDDASLARAAADIGRQTGLTMAFADPSLAALRFSGVLRLDRAQDWPAVFEAVLPVRLSRTATGYSVGRRSGS